ncbi:PIN domain-containing protein [Chryseobacterium jejuense]|uniref:PIN like domain-containing protein n=1 Tax=Chryseobacterium jejuense TaxID=445960 RepID=A0ABY0PFE2_CHRJE|nr:PIN domain-containing protein [Chryseobacterium jejuense]SDI26571.1 hypothetical protein SAMN05421542_0637 [Chryseobacterium jejuense]
MKTIFPGYYKKNEIEIKQIWDSGLILFDANVLLNLYRYSNTTRETIIDLIGKFSDKIYLPHQAALEYNRNRYEVIAEQEKAYKEFLNKISQIQQDLQSTNKHPFLSTSIDQRLNELFQNVSKEVEENIKRYCDFLKEDPIYDKLAELFENKITSESSNEELEDIYKEGERRYVAKIPPGFEDGKTKEGNRKFGDLVLWKQIIKLGKDFQKDIILITDERKIDWWWKIKDGRNMGPRQELVEEIYREANVKFHMYSSERFLSYGQTYLKEQIDKKALDEIQAMKSADLEILNELESIYRSRRNFKDINPMYERIEEIDSIIDNKNTLDLYSKNLNKKESLEEFIASYHDYLDSLVREKNAIKERIDLSNKYQYLNVNRHLNNEIERKGDDLISILRNDL